MNNVASISNEQLSDLRRDFDRLKSDIHEVRADLSGMTGDAARVAKAAAAEARERIGQTVKAAGAKGAESVQAIQHQVVAHPLTSIAAAFAVGMVLGFGLTRKG